MGRRSRIGLILWVLAVALLPVRMANAHLHLCLDGQEAPISVHVEDVPGHQDDADFKAGHHDHDVDVSGSMTVTKSASFALDNPIISAYVLAIVLPVEAPRVFSADVAEIHFSVPFTLRPPSRGPPA
ncbi:MAG TPA: hypothetical protein VFS24_10205 [Steroidobacteraceae bacterium]|nr:hypothetical protein [Steroidobacteraceae bacterium]